nr:MAG TPA: CXCXC repeat protein [Caudoviricetes sp.]DAQ66615.1 MAG TPA: CXCXC repeat protein [Caudoviricetes sp.]
MTFQFNKGEDYSSPYFFTDKACQCYCVLKFL